MINEFDGQVTLRIDEKEQRDSYLTISRRRLLAKSEYLYEMYQMEKGFLLDRDGVYTIPNNDGRIDSESIGLVMGYINTGTFPFDLLTKFTNTISDQTFLEKLSQAFAYYGVTVIPEEVYFIHSRLSPEAEEELQADEERDQTQSMVCVYDIEKARDFIFPSHEKGREKRLTLGAYMSRGSVPNFEESFQLIGTCCVEKDIYVVYLDSDRRTGLARYSTSQQKWEYMNTVPVEVKTMPNTGGGVVAVGSNIYVISGTSHWMYDTTTKEWRKHRAPKPKYCDEDLEGAVSVVGTEIFLFSGSSAFNSYFKPINKKLLKFDTKNPKKGWVRLRLTKGSFKGNAGRACTMNGKIYVTVDRNVLCFDPHTKELTVHSYFYILNTALGMFVMNGVLYLSQTDRLLWYCTTEEIWKFSSMVDVTDMVGIVVKGGSDTFASGDYNFFNLLIERLKDLDLNDQEQRRQQEQILEYRSLEETDNNKEDIERQLSYLRVRTYHAITEKKKFYKR
jgi:hypothetical protein